MFIEELQKEASIVDMIRVSCITFYPHSFSSSEKTPRRPKPAWWNPAPRPRAPGARTPALPPPAPPPTAPPAASGHCPRRRRRGLPPGGMAEGGQGLEVQRQRTYALPPQPRQKPHPARAPARAGPSKLSELWCTWTPRLSLGSAS